MSGQQSEGEAVRTTIVGGRPSGSGRGTGTIPRGVEVLLKKAAVDAEFRELLCEERLRAAEAIGLELDAAESAMLTAIPREQLESIIARTLVPVEQRRVFLGRMAAPMLALLGVAVTGCPGSPGTLGIRPARPVSAGIRPRPPGTNQPPTTPPATNRPVSPASDGIRPDRPVLMSAGIQRQAPSTNQPPAQPQPTTPPSTDPPVARPTRGIQPDRP